MAELAIPLVALGGLYLLNKKQTNTDADSYEDSTNYTDRYFTKDKNHFVQHKREEHSDKNFISLTGNTVDHNEIEHNNMQPYFGSSIKSMAKEQTHILDNKIGGGSLHTRKKEIAPLFSPSDNAHISNGTPVSTDFVQSRMVGSKTHKDKGWDEIHVGPGLDEGYTTDAIGGFNNALNARDSYRDKTIDELRTANNPKISYRGDFGPGKHFNAEVGVHGTVEKNRPDRHFEHGADRIFGGVSDHKKNSIRSEQVIPCTQRQSTTQEYYGTSRIQSGDTGYVDGEYREPHKCNLESYPVLNPHSRDSYVSNDNDYGVDGFNAMPNNRTLNKDRDGSLLGAAASMIGAVTMPFKEILQPTKKENLIDNIKNGGSIKVDVGEGYYINPGDRLKTTRKETTIENPYSYGIGGGAHLDKGGYISSKHQEAPTNRGASTREYSGIAGGNIQSMVSNTADYNADINTGRESTLESHPNSGNINLFNSDQNLTTERLDYDRYNNRMLVPQQLANHTPGRHDIGESTSNNNEYADLNRMDSDILTSLNSNPYAINF